MKPKTPKNKILQLPSYEIYGYGNLYSFYYIHFSNQNLELYFKNVKYNCHIAVSRVVFLKGS